LDRASLERVKMSLLSGELVTRGGFKTLLLHKKIRRQILN
jgi:hypothetical protein